MPQWLSHPAIQSGVAPFVVAVVVAAVLRRMGRVAGAAAVLAGLCVTVGWVTGFGLSPLTSTRKIILLGLAVAPVAVALEWVTIGVRWRVALWFNVGAAAIAWVAWPVLARRGLAEAVLGGLPLVLYCGGVTAVAGSGSVDRLRMGSGATALGLTTGAAALFGASALLGQLALAVGSAAGAALVVHLARGGDGGSRALGAAAGLPVALLGAAATLYAKMPVLALVPLALVPLAALLPVARGLPRWGRAGILFALALAPGLVSIFLTYRVAGPVPF
jgi:hypothetical protein